MCEEETGAEIWDKALNEKTEKPPEDEVAATVAVLAASTFFAVLELSIHAAALWWFMSWLRG